MQFGKNTHEWVFQRPCIILVLRTRAILIVFEKLTRACFFQIALETKFLSTLIKHFLLKAQTWSFVSLLHFCFEGISYMPKIGYSIQNKSSRSRNMFQDYKLVQNAKAQFIWKRQRRPSKLKSESKNCGHAGLFGHQFQSHTRSPCALVSASYEVILGFSFTQIIIQVTSKYLCRKL